MNRPTLHLPPRYLAMVQTLLRQHLPEAEVWAYGSRVRGDCHDTSDLDLVVRNPEALTEPCPDLADAAEAFSESNLPLIVQIVDWARIPSSFHAEILAGYAVVQRAGSEGSEVER
jgi:predicted nucleotidyltransferase